MIKKSEKVTPGEGLRIKTYSTFDLNRLLKHLRNWFKENKYDFNEVEHTNKSTDKGLEFVIRWESGREVNDYIKYTINVVLFLEEINKADNIEHGSVEITIKANVIADFKEKWKGSFLKNKLFFIYNNYIMREEIEKHKKKLEKEVKEFHSLGKSLLKV